jgi:hypothetical protein
VVDLISKDFIDEYSIIKLWRVSKKDDNYIAGFTSAYIGERENGKWVAVINNELMELNTRATAMSRLRKNGYFTRVRRVSIG